MQADEHELVLPDAPGRGLLVAAQGLETGRLPKGALHIDIGDEGGDFAEFAQARNILRPRHIVMRQLSRRRVAAEQDVDAGRADQAVVIDIEPGGFQLVDIGAVIAQAGVGSLARQEMQVIAAIGVDIIAQRRQAEPLIIIARLGSISDIMQNLYVATQFHVPVSFGRSHIKVRIAIIHRAAPM